MNIDKNSDTSSEQASMLLEARTKILNVAMELVRQEGIPDPEDKRMTRGDARLLMQENRKRANRLSAAAAEIEKVANGSSEHKTREPGAGEYKCMTCGMELDPEEYSQPSDADLCGYCITDRMNQIRARNEPHAPGQNECGIHREIVQRAEVELWKEYALKKGNILEANVLAKVLRLLEH